MKHIFKQHAASIFGFVRKFCQFRQSKKICVSVRSLRSFCVSKKIKECCQLLYDIARLQLMVPIDFWQDSTTFG